MSSQIANALSKARERTGLTSAPFMTQGRVPKAVVMPKYRNTQRTWVILMTVVMLITIAFIWSSNKLNTNESQVRQPRVKQQYPIVSESSTSPASEEPQPSRPEIKPEIEALIKSFMISAVMPGSVPRIIMQGRVIKVGETVERNLIFSGIKSGNLLFTDENGAVYNRHY